MKPYHLILGTGLLICACNTSTPIQENTTVIQPPLENVHVPEHRYTFSANEPYSISLQNGTQIDIPSAAFVDEEGKTVEGEVSITYQEFHSLSDIFLSGIPMNYDSGGVVHNFKSAGMFTIKGYSEGKPIFVAEGKEIDINMASETSDEDYTYNFYELDETGNWQYESTVSAERTPTYPKELIPEELEEPTGKELIIDLDVNYQGMRAEELNNITWQYDGDLADSTEIKQLLKQNWTDVQITKQENKLYTYAMELSGNKGETVIPVKPLLFGKDREAALANIEANINGLKQKLIEANTPPPNPYSRAITINGFGTYNYDIIHSDPDRRKLLAKFDFGKEVNMAKVNVALICPEQQIVINYNMSTWDKFSYNEDYANFLVAVLPGNEIAYLEPDGFEAIDAKDGEEYVFKLEMYPEKIESKEDFDNLLKSI